MTQEKINDNSEITANNKQIEILKKNLPQCFDKNGAFISNKMEEIVGGSGLEYRVLLCQDQSKINFYSNHYATSSNMSLAS